MKHQRVRSTEEIEWMQRWVRGMTDYEYPAAPKKEDEKEEEGDDDGSGNG